MPKALSTINFNNCFEDRKKFVAYATDKLKETDVCLKMNCTFSVIETVIFIIGFQNKVELYPK